MEAENSAPGSEGRLFYGRYALLRRAKRLRVLLRPTHLGPADYIRLLQLTLENIVPAGTEADGQAAQLKTSLAALSVGLKEQSSFQEIETALNTATDLIKKFFLGGNRRALDQVGELKAVMRTMTDTITFLSESRSTVVHQLTFIERQLEEATELDDIRLLRPRLNECLEAVRQETARLQEESSAHSATVRTQMGINSAGTASRRLGSLDLATGLPGRPAAERLLGEKSAGGIRCSLAVFVPERLAFVTKRHGPEGEAEVLLHVAHHLSKQMPPKAWLYRWSGPAFLAIRAVPEGESADDHLWHQIAGKHIEKTLTSERRSALVRVTLSCKAAVTLPFAPLDSMLKELDQFVTLQAAT